MESSGPAIGCAGTIVFSIFFPFFVMDQKKKTTSSEANKPVKTFRIDDVHFSVFCCENNGRDYYSLSFTRGYKAGSGELKFSRSFNPEDLGKLVAVAQRASEHLTALEQN